MAAGERKRKREVTDSEEGGSGDEVEGGKKVKMVKGEVEEKAEEGNGEIGELSEEGKGVGEGEEEKEGDL